MTRGGDGGQGGRPRYGLRGLVDGRERRFLLQPGVHQIGSLAAGDIVLPVKGVSRRHAVIAVDASGVSLLDLGSKNGTFLNGIRSAEARLTAGDVLQLGEARLTLEPLSAGEGDIAIRFRPPMPRVAGSPGEETSLLAREGRELLAVCERLVELLGSSAPEATANALRALAAACGAGGALLGEWDGAGEPAVLSACGDLGSWEASGGELIGLLLQPGGGDTWAADCKVDRQRLDQIYVLGRLRRPERDLLYLVLWGGDDEQGWTAGLIGIFLRLFDRRGPARDRVAAGAATHPPAANLVMPPGYVLAESRAMRDVYAALADLAATELPALFEGETGVGKEYLVRMLHGSSPRAGFPCVAINCAAIPAELLEAELFGIRKGVATGVDERKGRFQQAAGGTLFLDEIADLPANVQGKLLRVLQDREVQPLGGSSYPLDARVVAATNRSLEQEVAAGRFRADLYYRVAGYVVQVPALRQRRDDIPVLLESLVQRAAEEAGRWVRGITVEALGALVAYPWPGNVRELENEARRLVQRCPPGSAIDLSMLSDAIRRSQAAAAAGPAAAAGDPASDTASLAAPDDLAALDLQVETDRLQRRLIGRALEQTRGNRTRAAKLLGISRNGLAEKMDRLGIAFALVHGGGDS
jgi:DNA-binding NtrC family response regulator